MSENALVQQSIAEWSEPEPIEFDDLLVEKMPLNAARMFVKKHHYSRGLGNAAMCWGAYQKQTGRLIGVVAFQTPISENTRDFIFGDCVCGCPHVDPKECNRDDCSVRGDHHHVGEHVTELHRLAIVPEAPQNVASWLISKGLTRLKEYKPKYWAVISMADRTEGHDGTIYQATNADYYGTTDTGVHFIDEDGRLRNRRQCGENITIDQARRRGWEVTRRDKKHRYVYWLPYKSGRSKDGLRDLSQVELESYPGGGSE